jgi:hypothetical protein
MQSSHGPKLGRLSILWVLLLLSLTQLPRLDAAEFRGRQFIGLANFSNFAVARLGSETVLISPRIEPHIEWDELIASWNVEMARDDYLKIEARGIYPDHTTKFYTLALWSGDERRHPRESVKNQKDEDGNVLTDTLALKRPGAGVELRITLGTASNQSPPKLKFVGLSFCDIRAKPSILAPNQAAWGKTIDVPERSQMIHPNGEAWCSPASVSMVLAHWSSVLRRPELDRSVPDVAQAVFDKNWPGTGNWPFNTAFAGGFPGVTAYVTRMSDIAELEDWVTKNIPVVVSTSYGELKGTGKRPNDGHLVVCVGFTSTGDPIINDPGTRVQVRKTFPRENLAKAWAHSHHTAYLILPEKSEVPTDRFGHWFTR